MLQLETKAIQSNEKYPHTTVISEQSNSFFISSDNQKYHIFYINITFIVYSQTHLVSPDHPSSSSN